MEVKVHGTDDMRKKFESLPQVLTLLSFTVDSQFSASAISLPSSEN